MIGPETINLVAQASAERILDSLVEGTALAMFAWTLLRLVPRQNAATRFVVWFSVLIGAALLPLMSGWTAASPAASVRSIVNVPAAWAEYLFAAWLLAAFIGFARFAYGFLELRRLRSRSRAISPDSLDPQVVETLKNASRPVALLASQDVQVPTAVGFIHPAVILPEGLAQELSPAELNQVLLHELAHLRRWDDWTNMAAQVVKAVLCFHPAVWWVEQRIALEREMACDDAVLAATGRAREYAECLAHLAEKSFLRRTAALAQAAVSKVRQTTLRVARILDSGEQRASSSRWAVSFLGGFAVICVVTAWHGPRLISFSGAAAQTQTMARGGSIDAVQPAAGAWRDTSSQVIMARAVDHAPHASRTAKQSHAALAHAPKPQVAKAHVIRVKAVTPQQVQSVVLVYYVEGQSLDGQTIVWRMTVWQVTGANAQTQQVRKSI